MELKETDTQKELEQEFAGGIAKIIMISIVAFLISCVILTIWNLATKKEPAILHEERSETKTYVKSMSKSSYYKPVINLHEYELLGF